MQWPAQILAPNVERIIKVQQADGSIAWFEDGHLDPWDHTEAAMALSVTGHVKEARKAFEWLQNNQLPDGSWWESYRDGIPDKKERRETNFIAYVATGVWHHFLITQDKSWLRDQFLMVQSAIDCVLSAQSEYGEIQWAFDANGEIMNDALITGCASINRSLDCAVKIADVLGESRPKWRTGLFALTDALRNKPERFDRTWAPKTRFSMDWFYPVLAGIYSEQEAQDRLAGRWDTFVEQGLGCRCVSDEPWVTIAESCELVMALVASNQLDKAIEVFNWLTQWRDEQGVYWTGWQFRDQAYWPLEQPTWTCAAAVLAADAICKYSLASDIFSTSVTFDIADRVAAAI